MASRPPVGLQNLLLGLGTALVAISVIVFTAVNWSQLDASLQALILVAATLVAGGAAGVIRRSMPSTAEALGTVAVLLALADVHAVRVGLAPAADVSLFWAGGFAVTAVAAGAFGRSSRIRAPQIAAGLLVQAPLLCVLAAVAAPVWADQLALVAQAFAVLALSDRISAPRWAHRAATAWAVGVAALATAATTADSVIGALLSDADADLHRAGTACSFVAAALLAAFVAWRHVESDEVRPMALFAATSALLGAVWFGSIDLVGASTSIGLVALAAALLGLVGRQVPAPWGEVPSVTAGVVCGLAVLPLAQAVASMLTAASTVSAEAWQRSGSELASGLQLVGAPSFGALGIGLQLAAVCIAVLALLRRSALGLSAAAAVVALAALALSPLLAPLTIGGTVLLALVAVVLGTGAACALGGRHRAFPVAVGFAALAYAWATPWSVATPALTLGTLAVGIVAAAAVAAVARRGEAVEVAGGASTWLAVAVPALAGLAAGDAGVSAAMAWALGAGVVAVVSVIGTVVLDPKATAPKVSRVMREAVEATSLVAYAAAMVVSLQIGDPDAVSVVLAAGVLGFGLQAVRPGRRVLGLVAAVELLVFVWLRLDQADVVTVEAYTLPLAALLLGAGLVGARLGGDADGAPSSWITLGPAVVVGLAPTVWLAFAEPGSIRPLVGLVAGAVVLVAGVSSGKRALVDAGTATVVALGLRQVAPVVGEVPNWVTIGATGIVLIAVGATFEQRRRDLKAVVRRYSALT